MTLALHFVTFSGSTYAVTVDGTVTYRSDVHHPLGQVGTFETDRITALPNGSFEIGIAGTDRHITTSTVSREACQLIPIDLLREYGTWKPTVAVTDGAWIGLKEAALRCEAERKAATFTGYGTCARCGTTCTEITGPIGKAVCTTGCAA